MKIKQLILIAIVCMFSVSSFAASMPTEPLGGHPPKDVKSPSAEVLNNQVTYQRSFESVPWFMSKRLDHDGIKEIIYQ